jgi:hypothetical protein
MSTMENSKQNIAMISSDSPPFSISSESRTVMEGNRSEEHHNFIDISDKQILPARVDLIEASSPTLRTAALNDNRNTQHNFPSPTTQNHSDKIRSPFSSENTTEFDLQKSKFKALSITGHQNWALPRLRLT